jgi:hypothetical protein
MEGREGEEKVVLISLNDECLQEFITPIIQAHATSL